MANALEHSITIQIQLASPKADKPDPASDSNLSKSLKKDRNGVLFVKPTIQPLGGG